MTGATTIDTEYIVDNTDHGQNINKKENILEIKGMNNTFL